MIIHPSEQTIDAIISLKLASGVEVEIKVLDGGKMTNIARRTGLSLLEVGMTQILQKKVKQSVTLL